MPWFLTKPEYKDIKYWIRVYHFKELNLHQHTYKSKNVVDFIGYGTERELFLFACGRPQPVP
jgi:hypothetical protein